MAYINADINRNETGNAGRRYPHAPFSSISMLQEYLNNGQLEMADSIYMGIVNRTVARVGNEISALNGNGSNVNVSPMPGNTTPLN